MNHYQAFVLTYPSLTIIFLGITTTMSGVIFDPNGPTPVVSENSDFALFPGLGGIVAEALSLEPSP
jgi:hypothetical protein